MAGEKARTMASGGDQAGMLDLRVGDVARTQRGPYPPASVTGLSVAAPGPDPIGWSRGP